MAAELSDIYIYNHTSTADSSSSETTSSELAAELSDIYIDNQVSAADNLTAASRDDRVFLPAVVDDISEQLPIQIGDRVWHQNMKSWGTVTWMSRNGDELIADWDNGKFRESPLSTTYISKLSLPPLKNGSITWTGLIAEIDRLMKGLGWSINQGREYLKQKYGKISRQLLSDQEILEFWQDLKISARIAQAETG